ncbi:MAG: 50S ribosomal protein L4 [Gemmataceae bacterium]
MATETSPLIAEVSGALDVPVFNKAGQPAGSIQVDAAEFGGKINKQLLHDVVLMFEANQRAGTHSTLRRGEVAGSTKKLFRQKGTGNARVGPRRTNKRRGGGTAKGPKPRDYEYHLPKKAVRLATRMAVLSKLHDKEALIVDDLGVTTDGPKTKEVAAALRALALAVKVDELPPVKEGETPPTEAEIKLKKKKRLLHATWLIGTAGLDQKLYRSARNIRGVELLPVAQFNAYTILKQKRLVLTRAALDELRKKS